MKIAAQATVQEREPNRQPCSLLGECDIELGGRADFEALAAYHYRDAGYPPAVHQVYRARHRPSGRTVGVIVYAAPALNLGIRNKIFGDRYKIGMGQKNLTASTRLNAEVELIIRVVIHPTFRGVSLGQRLIRETLVQRPYPIIEMSAAMGAVNPFAERAGMRAIKMPKAPTTQRVLSALEGVGIRGETLGNPSELMRRVQQLAPHSREFIEREMIRYATRWIKSRTKRDAIVTVEVAAKRIASNALLDTMYYVFTNNGNPTAA